LGEINIYDLAKIKKGMSDYFDPEKSGKSSKKGFNPSETKRPKDVQRVLQTFLRNSYRSHISLFAIADRKANIMLRLNSFLLSAALIFFKNILGFNDLSIITLVLFLLTTLISLVLAAMAARPVKETDQKIATRSPESIAENLFINTHLMQIDEEDFENAFGIMMEDSSLIYGNMSRELYRFRMMLVTKYRLLRKSYNVFIYGFVLTILSFFINLLLVN
jgi:Ca2+/Na+ antiporter